jgi:hypothetical protein
MVVKGSQAGLGGLSRVAGLGSRPLSLSRPISFLIVIRRRHDGPDNMLNDLL